MGILVHGIADRKFEKSGLRKLPPSFSASAEPDREPVFGVGRPRVSEKKAYGKRSTWRRALHVGSRCGDSGNRLGRLKTDFAKNNNNNETRRRDSLVVRAWHETTSSDLFVR